MPFIAFLAAAAPYIQQAVEFGIKEAPLVTALIKSWTSHRDSGRADIADSDLDPLRNLILDNQREIDAANTPSADTAGGDTITGAPV